MPRRDFTIWFLLLSFFFKEFSRSLLVPNLIVISDFFFGPGPFEAIEIGVVIAVQMGGSAAACLLFGILADKSSRKKITSLSLLIWISGLLLIGFASSYPILLIGSLLLGFGAGGYTPVAQAIIGDATPHDKRGGQVYGWSSMFMVIGYFSGLFFASAFSPSWQLPFLLIAIPITVLSIWYLFKGRTYQLGMHEPELQVAAKAENYIYEYRLTKSTFKAVLQNRTNILIFIEGIFSVIGFSMITIYLFPFLEASPAHITPFIVSLMYLLFITPPYLFGIFLWGRIGDNLVKKYSRIRVLLVTLSFFITIPLFMAVFWIRGSPSPLTDTLGAALANPGILLFFVLFAVGIFLTAMYDPNQPPILNAINLPETRGSVFALNRFVEEVGGALGPLIVGIIFESAGQDFSLAMTLGMLCMIPGAACWMLALKTYPKDRNLIQKTLTERAKEAMENNIKKS